MYCKGARAGISIVELESSLHQALKFRDEKLVDSGTTLVYKGTISSPGGLLFVNLMSMGSEQRGDSAPWSNGLSGDGRLHILRACCIA
jgi:hypothetical protein